MNRSKFLYKATVFAVIWAAMAVAGRSQGLTTTAPSEAIEGSRNGKLAKIQHIVVIYQENHSFDNLYGGWEGVNGRASADSKHTVQVGQAGAPYTCLLQNDVNLAALPANCTDTTTGSTFTSHFVNSPFSIEAFIP